MVENDALSFLIELDAEDGRQANNLAFKSFRAEDMEQKQKTRKGVVEQNIARFTILDEILVVKCKVFGMGKARAFDTK